MAKGDGGGGPFQNILEMLRQRQQGMVDAGPSMGMGMNAGMNPVMKQPMMQPPDGGVRTFNPPANRVRPMGGRGLY